jgi:hypothetical protein
MSVEVVRFERGRRAGFTVARDDPVRPVLAKDL